MGKKADVLTQIIDDMVAQFEATDKQFKVLVDRPIGGSKIKTLDKKVK